MRHAMILSVALAAGLGIGCAGSGRSKSADTVAGVTTVDQELGQANDQLTKTVEVLGALVDGPASGLNEAYDRFVGELEKLDDLVQTLRDRSVAMNAKRDAYLKHWIEQTSKIQNEDMKKAAEARRTQFMSDFMELNAKGAALKKAYAPVTASLHDCQRFLEADLNPASVKTLSGELEKIRSGQKEVDAAAKDLRSGFKALSEKLSIPAPAPAPKEEPKPAEKK